MITRSYRVSSIHAPDCILKEGHKRTEKITTIGGCHEIGEPRDALGRVRVGGGEGRMRRTRMRRREEGWRHS